MAKNKVILGIDIGSNSVIGVVATYDSDKGLLIEAICEKESEGVSKGEILNQELATRVLSNLISELEIQTGLNLTEAIISIGGSHIKGINSLGVAGITNKDKEITRDDIVRSLSIAKSREMETDRAILQTLVKYFKVDSKTHIKDPLHMMGHRLESIVLLVTAAQSRCQAYIKFVEKSGIAPNRLFLSSLADSEVVLSNEDKEIGVIVINIGSSSTNMIAYSNGGDPIYVGGVDFGSDSVTSDISYILGKPKLLAEKIKCEYGSCYLPSVNPQETLIIPGIGSSQDIKMYKASLVEIIEARMSEIFNILRNDLLNVECDGNFAAGIVLVGGGALMPGITELASEIFFSLPTRVGFPEALAGLDREYITPKYTTCLGLIKTEAKKYLNSTSDDSKSNNKGIGKFLKNLFRR